MAQGLTALGQEEGERFVLLLVQPYGRGGEQLGQLISQIQHLVVGIRLFLADKSHFLLTIAGYHIPDLDGHISSDTVYIYRYHGMIY